MMIIQKTNTEYAAIWEALRVDWVNGNRADAARHYQALNKRHQCGVVHAAIMDFCDGWHGCDHNGALTDLAELMAYIKNGN